MRLFCSVFILLLNSCIDNKSCVPNYIGTFAVDMSLISDSSQARQIYQRKWDTVKLISGSDGKYYFNTDDPVLKESEGSWYTKSNDIEGNCYGYIQQKNLDHPYTGTFGIVVKLSGSTAMSLPFKKIK